MLEEIGMVKQIFHLKNKTALLFFLVEKWCMFIVTKQMIFWENIKYFIYS